jgi:hypothetical protein
MAPVSAPPTPAIPSLAGDLALHDASRRAALQARGLLTAGLPRTVEPLTPLPTPEDLRRLRRAAGLNRQRPPHQVHLACAGGDRRPVVERISASRRCRGALRLTDTGDRGAIVHTGMTVMAHNAATLRCIQQNRLSKRAPKLR